MMPSNQALPGELHLGLRKAYGSTFDGIRAGIEGQVASTPFTRTEKDLGYLLPFEM